MSVWASIYLVDCWTEGCEGCDECGAGQPYRYEHSGVLPEPDMLRGGTVDAAYLSAFVRWNRDHPDSTTEPEGLEPWLRLSVNKASVVLDRAQVEQLVARLATWVGMVDRTAPTPTEPSC